MRVRLRWTAMVLLAAAGCRCGGGAAGKNAEEFIGPDASFVVSVPNLGALAERSQALLVTARAGAGGSELVALSANLARQLGFDPLTREGQAAAGLDPAASFALGGGGRGRAGGLTALPYADLARLEATVERLAKDRAGAGVKETREQDGVSVTVLTRAPGALPLLAYATRDHYLLLGAGDDALANVAAALKRPPAESVASLPLYASAKQKVGAREAYLYLPKSGSLTFKVVPDVLVLGVGLTAKELSLRGYLALPEAARAAAAALVGGGDGPLGELPKGAPVYLRGGIDLAAVVREAGKTEQGKDGLEKLRAAALEVGIDFDQEVVANLEPGFALSLGLAPTVNLSTAFDLDPRRTNVFQNYSLLAVGRVKDAAKGAATMERLAAVVEKLGNTVASRQVAGAKVYTANYRLGEGMSWMLQGNDLVLAGGFGDRLPALVEGLKGRKDGLSPTDFAPRAKEALFGKDGAAVAVDFGKIGEAVGKLPDDAFGTGPGAFMARSAASGVVQQLSRLRAVAAVAPVDGGLMVDLSVSTP